jgi:hypothetical protein
VAAALNAARAAARKGDAAAFDAAYKRITSLAALTFVQGTLEYAEKLEAARKAGKPTDGIQVLVVRRWSIRMTPARPCVVPRKHTK